MVVFSKNPINSVLFLIFSFINTAGIFLIAGAEFLALILVIVYVGAVAVLFLFVIMMLDLDVNQIKGEIKKYYKVGIPIGLILLVEMGLIIFLNRLVISIIDILIYSTLDLISLVKFLSHSSWIKFAISLPL